MQWENPTEKSSVSTSISKGGLYSLDSFIATELRLLPLQGEKRHWKSVVMVQNLWRHAISCLHLDGSRAC